MLKKGRYSELGGFRSWEVANIQCKRQCKSVPKIVYAIRRFPLLGGVAMRGSTVFLFGDHEFQYRMYGVTGAQGILA